MRVAEAESRARNLTACGFTASSAGDPSSSCRSSSSIRTIPNIRITSHACCGSRKPSTKPNGVRVYCFECRRPIKFVSEFFFDPNYSQHPYHVSCVLRKEKYDPKGKFMLTYLWGVLHG